MVHPQADPFLQSEALEIRRIVHEGDRWSFEHVRALVIIDVVNEVELGVSRSGEDFFDAQAVDALARRKVRRVGQTGKLAKDIILVAVREGIDAQDDA